ncbi:hypothetical protein P152DRAFT_485810 [Eremomyces bilateralis CBS 781.70]|uniref:GED domain-containing protein n=1 Tax=Eremomyces bilateralis CBS 781.70 TaxID=1392243 RepID=A0A6G1FQN3_9PEZI|nr:uncharacterized protein P152DRAFT_485810 [Eremomyces bilateralis CBS 781.70]KAF1807999.1 hypothetical protein P152DRAFT_485810 [Eremomyces bilateralis CBS 781.70]
MAKTASAEPQGSPPVLLQNSEHRDLFDIVDKLRSQGIGRYIDLPQIIICGDQSSGKSSALEAISGMSFPTKDTLCTRFATELILRRSPTVGVNICIIPSPEQPEQKKEEMRKFSATLNDMDIGHIIESAKAVMGLNDTGKVFSSDILRVEISGPEQPHLTLVDLPGLFTAGNKDQSDEDAEMVESLVLSYMEKPRSVICAVVSAKNEFALHERYYVNLAQNKDVKFRLGWHVLKNRDFNSRNATTAERDRSEANFFARGVWTSLSPSQLGKAALVTRLGGILGNHILQQLPSVLQDVETEAKECRDTLDKLGAGRATLADQRRYLLNIGQRFYSLIKAAVDGVYTDPFLSDVTAQGVYERRLRAVVQNALSDFSEEMCLEGHAQAIVEHASPNKRREISRDEYIDEVQKLMRKSRGRELPSTFNPLVVEELFSKQCQPWSALIYNLVDRILEATFAAVSATLKHVTDIHTAEKLLARVINPSLDGLKKDLNLKVDEILGPHLCGHPITYNHYLTDTVQRVQAKRRAAALERQLVAYFDDKGSVVHEIEYHHFNMKSLVETLSDHTEVNMDKFACSLATDMMEAYYKVARKTVVDGISVLAIEKCLLQKLPELISAHIVCDMGDDKIQQIAAEDEDSAQGRAHATKKLGILESSLIELKRMNKYHVAGSQSFGYRPRSRFWENADIQTDSKEKAAALDGAPGNPPGSDPQGRTKIDMAGLNESRQSGNSSKVDGPMLQAGGSPVISSPLPAAERNEYSHGLVSTKKPKKSKKKPAEKAAPIAPTPVYIEDHIEDEVIYDW